MTVFRASYWILLCNCGLPTVFLLCEARGSPFGIFFDVIHFLDTQFREILVCFLVTKIMAFTEIAKWNHSIFLQNDGLLGSLFILFCNCWLPTVFLFCDACLSPSSIFFDIIHFVDTQFRENLSVFPWHQNYGFCRDREMKSFYFSPKWRSSGLPIELFCVTAGFQRSSYCVKPVEVRLAFFLCNTFCRYSVSRKS